MGRSEVLSSRRLRPRSTILAVTAMSTQTRASGIPASANTTARQCYACEPFVTPRSQGVPRCLAHVARIDTSGTRRPLRPRPSCGRDIRRQPRSMAVKRQTGHSLTSSESLILRDDVVSRRLLSSTRALALPQCRTLDGKSHHVERTHFSRPAAAASPSAARTPCSRVRRPVR